MKAVDIGTLKNDLVAYLQQAHAGEELVVMDAEKPVARILPVHTPASAEATIPAEEEQAQLVASGILELPQEEMDWQAFWALPRPTVSDEAAREAILWAKGYRK